VVAGAERPERNGGPAPGAGAVRIGVLDLQGDVREHVAALADVGAGARLVKRPADLDGVDGLILPGGESTTLSMLLESTGLFDAVAERLAVGAGADAGAGAAAGALPILGTCAGLVLVSRQILDGRPDQKTFDVLDAVVRRNGYGRQVHSFEGEVVLGAGGERPLPAVFIRAPLVVSVGGDVEVLGTFDDVPVLVRQGPVLASVFHPELTPDRRVHRTFVEMCRSARAGALTAGPAPVGA
jgi:pyridoxal 5'-phosphate synthase pdxT subunit